MMALNLRDFDAESERFGGFDANSGQASPTEEPLFSFTEEELGKMLAEARTQGAEQGHADGLIEGRRAAQADHQVQATAALNDLREQVATFVAQDALRRAELERDLVDMVLDVCERLVPDLLQAYSTEQVQARLTKAIHIGSGHSDLSVQLSPETEKSLATELNALVQADSKTHLTITADPALKDGEAHVSWNNGFMNYSLDRVCAELLEALRDASEQMKQQTQKV